MFSLSPLEWFRLLCMVTFAAGVLIAFAITLRVQIHFDVWTDVTQPNAVQMEKVRRATWELWHGQEFRRQRKMISICTCLCLAALAGLALTDPRSDVPDSAPVVRAEGEQQ